MNHVQIPFNVSGKDMLLDASSIEFFQRTINITGEINDALAEIVCSELRYLDRINDDDIKIFINSPGGSVTAGMSIYDTIKALSNDVCIVATGVAASMASFLLACAGAKGKRYAMPNAEIMIHQPLGGAQGQASDIKIVAEHIIKTKNKLNSMLCESTGQPIEVIERDTDRDNWMSAAEAKEYGLIDQIVNNFEEDLLWLI